jgi:hypothetical protein
VNEERASDTFTNMENDHPFSPAFQRRLLAILLQLPETYCKYDSIWDASYFDDSMHAKIAHAYIIIREIGSEHPDKVSVEQEILKGYDAKVEYPSDIIKLKAELDTLYTFPIQNINYSMEEVRQWAMQHALVKAIDVSFGFIQAGKPEKVLEIMLRAANVGDESHLAKDAFFQTEPQLPQEIIPGVLRAESIGIMSSSSKSYKTWNLLAACIAAGMGKSWMGFERCKPVRVLYVNLELHTEELKKRIDMVAAAMGTTRAALQGHVDFLNLKGQRNQIDRVLARIRSYGNANGPWRLIMIDPVYKLYSSDDTKDNSENSTSAIAAMFEKLEVLARELEAAIILVHHFRKGNQGNISDIDLGSGSWVFARAPDCMIYLRDLEEEDQAWKCSLVLRYFPAIKPFGVRLGTGDQFPLLVRDETLDLTKEAGRPGAKTKYCVEEVVALLPEEGLTNKAWKTSATKDVGCSETTFRDLRDNARERGLVQPNGDTNKHSTLYIPTSEGEKAIQVSKN